VTNVSKILLVVAAGWIFSQSACSHSSNHAAGQPAVTRGSLALSAAEAAQLAAQLANDQCARLYQKQPFAAGQHPAVLRDGSYHWGGLDVGGEGGFSAQVTFRRDGSKPRVEVYFSTDVLKPENSRPQPSPAELPPAFRRK